MGVIGAMGYFPLPLNVKPILQYENDTTQVALNSFR